MRKATKAKTRKELTTIIKALDRALRAMHIWIPQWYKSVHTVAYKNQYSYPTPLPPFELGTLDFWWFDKDKYQEIKGK